MLLECSVNLKEYSENTNPNILPQTFVTMSYACGLVQFITKVPS